MGHSGTPASDNYATPSIPAHGGVVAYAKSRIGCPYVWAASGPSEFDCSGLAMWCYGKIGISLPHSSQEQYNSGPHVSRKDLEPGDLVFFGSPIHHVGIYVGGGEMIEAPYTGARVRYASAFRSDYAGACRPN
jgi:cell wall-associated NlpC family hydrolase